MRIDDMTGAGWTTFGVPYTDGGAFQMDAVERIAVTPGGSKIYVTELAREELGEKLCAEPGRGSSRPLSADARAIRRASASLCSQDLGRIVAPRGQALVAMPLRGRSPTSPELLRECARSNTRSPR